MYKRQRLGILDDLLEPRGHGLAEGLRARQRTDHDHEVVDQAVLVHVQEVAAGQLPVADPRPEDQRVVRAVRVADLPDVPEVVEDVDHRAQHRRGDRLARVRLEDDRAGEDDVLGQQCLDGVQVPGLHRLAERAHRLTPLNSQLVE